MTESNALECINLLKAAFPSYKLNGDETAKAIELWCSIFPKTSYETVSEAIGQYIKGGAEFPPTVGQIRKIVSNKARKDPQEVGGGYWTFESYTIPAKDVRIKTPEGLVPVYEPDDETPIEYGRRVWVGSEKEATA